ncbi:hypothetical protein N7520_007403 [Penicillium odoratum]|uniref:uncharacterized protein n=1 Tax=Penicillium odoratum TaxID=1167516 RepID=UPI0025465A82|nr:uncharacterized protein N7520_007403 [Penicillium odoratum]KAJ5760247.1 hypothetical protein N7520_007403 [Penicillium odoratum]
MRGGAPPLPPRPPACHTASATDAVPNAIVMDEGRPSDSLYSLSLPRPEATWKRRLLLIYIHGFMGSEASFNDFPAHVHHLLTAVLSESYVVYTRIYPRYKSRGEIQTAVDQFSNWLSPHEADDLDVILLGHSLGGILAADVALMQGHGIPDIKPKHRILGLINFDVPLLGLHPRVIPTGIGSLFQKKGNKVEASVAESLDSLSLDTNSLVNHPNFDPPFKNDVRLVKRDTVDSIMHFFNKNTDRLSQSLVDLLFSPVKFASCVNEYPTMRMRYRRLIELGSGKPGHRGSQFVNYYTASTGRKSQKSKTKPATKSIDEEIPEEVLEDAERTNDTIESKGFQELDEITQTSCATCENSGESPKTESTLIEGPEIKTDEHPSSDDLPIVDTHPIASDAPQAVQSVDIEVETQLKGTQSLTSSISVDKMETTSLSDDASSMTSAGALTADTPPEKLRKFILLPSHHWRSADNSLWVPLVMEDMDEVVAHQSIFLAHGKHYDRLVGETVTQIEQWVQNDLTLRALS